MLMGILERGDFWIGWLNIHRLADRDAQAIVQNASMPLLLFVRSILVAFFRRVCTYNVFWVAPFNSSAIV